MNAELTKTKKWVLAGVCATVILCCAGIQTVFAQNYEAVGRRLRAAVAAGELTGEQARAMLGTLRQAAQPDKKAGDRDADMEGAVKRVRAAIEAGEITPEQGRAKLQAMRKRMAAGTSETKDRDSRAVYAAAEKEIQAAVEAGKITREQGRERLAGLRRNLAAGGEARERRGEPAEENRDPRAVYAAAEKEIQAAVEAGSITRAQGRERLAGLRRRLAADGEARERRGEDGEEGRDLQAMNEAAEKRIREAVRAGKMTREEGRAAYEGLKKRMAAGARGQRTREENTRGERTRERDLKAVYQAAEKEIKAAIKAGKITEAQGRERLAGLRRHMAEGDRETRDDGA